MNIVIIIKFIFSGIIIIYFTLGFVSALQYHYRKKSKLFCIDSFSQNIIRLKY